MGAWTARAFKFLVTIMFLGMMAGLPSTGEMKFGEMKFGEAKFEIPLDFSGAGSGPHTSLSVGSVGLDSQAGDTYVPRRGDDPYYFRIPSERPFKKVPGLTVKIPFGRDWLP